MIIGRLNERIDIQQYVTTDDGYGGKTGTWTTLATVWANIKPLRGREVMEGQQIDSIVDYEIMIRYRSGIKADMRVKQGDRTYNILATYDVTGKQAFLTLRCSEVDDSV